MMGTVWSTYRRLYTWSERLAAEKCKCGKPGLWIAMNIGGSNSFGIKTTSRKFVCDDCHKEECKEKLGL